MMVKAIVWTDELANRICEELVGGRSIRQIAAQPWAPSEPTIYRRMASDTDFAEKINRAREAQQDYEADVCVEMADRATPEDWQVVKLQIWARQWRASKLAPKKYGDKIGVEHSGSIELASALEAARKRLSE